MNVFMHGKIEAGFEVLKAKVDADMAGPAGEFCTDYRLADLGDGEVMFCANVTDFEKMGAKAKAQAIKPFISQAPLPYNLSSFIVALKGSVDHPGETGTTSVCPDKIIGILFCVFLDLIVEKRFTLFFSLS